MAEGEDDRVDKSSLQPGDHISVDRKQFADVSLYSHHGIYTGDHPNEVINVSVSNKNKFKAEVRACTLEEFLEGGAIRACQIPCLT